MPANEPELVGAIRVNRPNGAFMTAPKTCLSIGLHVAPCTIPDTNPSTGRTSPPPERDSSNLVRALLSTPRRNRPGTSPNRVGEFRPHPRRLKRARHVRYWGNPPSLSSVKLLPTLPGGDLDHERRVACVGKQVCSHPHTTAKGALSTTAIRVSEYGGPSVLKLEEVPTLQPGQN